MSRTNRRSHWLMTIDVDQRNAGGVIMGENVNSGFLPRFSGVARCTACAVALTGVAGSYSTNAAGTSTRKKRAGNIF